jgi:two-component system response regulator
MNQEAEILLVEDNNNDAELALRALQKCNLARSILRVSDGEEALDYIFSRGRFLSDQRLNIPKLILLDLKLPKIDGIGVLKEIKADPVAKLIPVVVLTSSSEECDIVETYSLGVNSYIVKPVDFEKFVDSIKHIGLYWLLMNQLPDLKILVR